MEAFIHLTDGNHLADIKITEADGSVTKKKISLESLMEIFSKKEPREYFRPCNTFKGNQIPGLLYGREEEGEITGIFFVPGEARFMNVAGEKKIIPYPSVLFLFHAKNGSRQGSRCFAMKEASIDEVREDSELYAFPFGNVQSGSGVICWGSNKLGGLYNYEDLRAAVTTFFCSESNMDYVTTGRSYDASYGSYQQFLKKIGNLEQFPQEALVLSPYKNTLKDLITSVK